MPVMGELIRRASTFNTSRVDHLYVDPHDKGAKLFLHCGDLSDGSRLATLLAQIQPDKVYKLAAQSHVRVSFDEPEHTADTTGVGTIRLLEAVLEELITSEWPEWDSVCKKIEDEAGVVLLENEVGYRAATILALSEPCPLLGRSGIISAAARYAGEVVHGGNVSRGIHDAPTHLDVLLRSMQRAKCRT